MKTTYALCLQRRTAALACLIGLAVMLQACAGLRPGHETPTVNVNSFRALPSDGMLPSFEIGLPVIEAYGEGQLMLTASANLLAGIRLFCGPHERHGRQFQI